MKKLSEIIKKIEDKGGIDKFYLHYSYDLGNLQLNIEFKNNIADGILDKSGINKIEECAYWE